MTDFGDAIDEARAEIADAAIDFFPDLCTIYLPSNTPDSAGGWTESLTVVESDVPCSYRALNVYERTQGDAIQAISSHEIQLPATEVTIAISGEHEIVVDERGLESELSFRITGRLPGASELYVYLGATLGD